MYTVQWHLLIAMNALLFVNCFWLHSSFVLFHAVCHCPNRPIGWWWWCNWNIYVYYPSTIKSINNQILTSTSKLAFVNSSEFSSALVAARRTRLLQRQCHEVRNIDKYLIINEATSQKNRSDSANSSKSIALSPCGDWIYVVVSDKASAASHHSEWQYIVKKSHLPVLRKVKSDPTSTSRPRSTPKLNHRVTPCPCLPCLVDICYRICELSYSYTEWMTDGTNDHISLPALAVQK